MTNRLTELGALFDELVGLDDADRAERLRKIGRGSTCRTAIATPPSWPRSAHLLVFAGEPENARTAAEAAYAQSPTAIFDWITLDVLYGYALERTGRSEQARTVLAEAERYARARMEEGSERRGFRYALARIDALRGETDNALRWLDHAIDLGWNVAAITASDPLLESLRDDPRFQAALNRMEADLAPKRARVENETP